MKRAVVVKALTEQILLARTDTGELVSLSVPCRSIRPGSLLVLDTDTDRCPIHSVEGKSCQAVCHRANHAMIIQHKDKDPTEVPMDNERGDDRHAI